MVHSSAGGASPLGAANGFHGIIQLFALTLFVFAADILGVKAQVSSSASALDDPLLGFHASRKLFSGFKTEPSLDALDFDLSFHPSARSQIAPGYLFLAIMFRDRSWGIQIYDLYGELVWHGPSTPRAQNVHVCDYLGQNDTHLCFSQRMSSKIVPHPPATFPPDLEVGGIEPVRMSYGWNVILDNTYTPKGESFSELGGGYPINGHAFQMQDGGDSFVSPYKKFAITDLRPYGGDKIGWVRNECISELDVATRKSVFDWCSLEGGLEVWESYTWFESEAQLTNATSFKVGNGTRIRPWDFLHMNAVDKTSDGDYLVSIRHLDQILKIAGPNNSDVAPGSVIWRLGGKRNEFSFENFPHEVPFSRQHDIRFISRSGPEEVISLFNNAWDGVLNQTSDSSEAQIISVNARTKRARLEHRFPHPYGILAEARGSAQQLPNGNMLVGWGQVPQYTEFDSNGVMLYHANYSHGANTNRFSYRALKYPWIGNPLQPPKLLAYAPSCRSLSDPGSPITAYVSWNGATEVDSWQFSMAPNRQGPWVDAGNVRKRGFETQAVLRHHQMRTSHSKVFVAVEALDNKGNALRNTMSRTFVPKLEHKWKCDMHGCKRSFRYTESNDGSSMCEYETEFALGGVILLALCIETIWGLAQRLVTVFSGVYRQTRIS